MAKRAKERSESVERTRSKSAVSRKARVRTETLKNSAGTGAPPSRSSRGSVPNTRTRRSAARRCSRHRRRSSNPSQRRKPEGEGSDGPCRAVPLPLQQVLVRCGDQHGPQPAVQGQLFAFKWKMFTWMLRVKRAVRMEGGPKTRWKRNPQWLMLLFGRQLAAMWGHLRSARQLCNDPKHANLMHGQPSAVATRPED